MNQTEPTPPEPNSPKANSPEANPPEANSSKQNSPTNLHDIDETAWNGARWLVEHANDALGSLDSKDTAETGPINPLKLVAHFRKKYDAQQTRMLCDLLELRRRSAAKFSKAEEMFLSRVGYEQSTSEAIASYKSQRYMSHTSVADLCCGIGGDAVALAKVSGELTLVDVSGAAIEFAKANLNVYGQQATGFRSDVRNVDLSRYSAWHLDPDRRVDGNRRSTPDACEPPLNAFIQLPNLADAGAVKLSPAADASELLDRGVELEWIGNQHECQQQVAWFGELAQHPGKRTATWLCGKANQTPTAVTRLVEDDPRETPTDIPTIIGSPQYVYEARPSVLAAGLDLLLAEQFGLKRLARNCPYLASSKAEVSELFRRFKVIEMLPFHPKTLKRQLATSELRVTEVKKRAVDVSPEQLLRQLNKGQKTSSNLRAVVALLYPVGASVHVVLAERDD